MPKQSKTSRKVFRIAGRVIDRKTRSGIAGLRVEAWDKDLIVDDLVGNAVADQDGAFAIEFKESYFRELFADRQPDLFFRVYQEDRLVASTEDSVLWNIKTGPTEVVIEVDLAGFEKQSTGDQLRPSIVRGQVRLEDGSPAAGAIVRAFDKDLRSETLIGEAKTDSNGQYRITYSTAAAEKDATIGTDLLVRIFAEDGDLIVESPVRFGAGPATTIDLMFGGGVYEGASEYERLTETLAPHIGTLHLAEVTEADLKFLAGKTGIEPGRLAMLVQAHREAPHVHLSPAIVYAFARQGRPVNPATIRHLSATTIRETIERSLADNIVPLKTGNEIDSIINVLKERGLRDRLTTSAPGQPALGSILGTVLTSIAEQESFLALFVGHRGTDAEFWSSLSKHKEFASQTEDLQAAMQLAKVAQYHPPMVAKLMEMRRDRETPAIREFAKLDEADWLNIISGSLNSEGTGMPSDGALQSPAAYARAITAAFEDAYPSMAVADRIRRQLMPDSNGVVSFLELHDDFDLKRTYITKFLADRPETRAALPDPDHTIRQLKSMQRLLRVTQRVEPMMALYDAKLHSAHKIAQLDRGRFVTKFAAAFGGVNEAEAAHARAEQTAATAMAVFGGLGRAVNNLPFVVAGVLPEGVDEIPDWRELFGNSDLDLGECQSCRSVLSPAAYLAELLAYLQARQVGDEGNGTALDVLCARRPDLVEIELSCANTDTLVPYIDLVNEILEDQVAPETAESARHRQTTWTSDELAANPEHVNRGTYEKLKTVGYPFSLPFDLWLEEGRTFLASLGVSRVDLMRTFQRPGPAIADPYGSLDPLNRTAPSTTPRAVFLNVAPHNNGRLTFVPPTGVPPTVGPQAPTDFEIAYEFLGISPQEAAIIGDERLASLGAHWGDPAADSTPSNHHALLVNDLRRVSTLLARAGLTYQELFDILSTRFVNSTATAAGFKIESVPPAPEDTTNPALLNVPLLNELALGRIHRFVRLWRRLGWSIVELDTVLISLGGQLTPPVLFEVAHVEWLRRELALPLQELVVLWSEMRWNPNQPNSPGSLFERAFFSHAVRHPAQDPFRIAMSESFAAALLTAPASSAEAAGFISIPNGMLDFAPAILAAVESSDHDLQELLRHGAITVDLTLSNLSQLYRYTRLAKGLGVSTSNLLAAERLFGRAPFLAQVPNATVAFVRRFRALQRGKLSIAALAEICLDDLTEPAQGMVANTLASLLTKLQDGLATIMDESVVDPGLLRELATSASTADLSDATNVRLQALKKKLAVAVQTSEIERTLKFLCEFHARPEPNADALLPLLFPGFDPDEAAAALLAPAVPVTEEERISYLWNALDYLLRTRPSESFVTQTIAETFAIDPAVAGVLSRSLIWTRSVKPRGSQPAMSGLLSLPGRGLSADFLDASGATVASSVEPDITFDWGLGAAPDRLERKLGFSVRLSGKLFAPVHETYRFFVRTSGGVRLTIDRQVLIDELNNAVDSAFEGETILAPTTGEWLYGITLEFRCAAQDTSASRRAFVDLQWASPSTPKSPILTRRLLAGSDAAFAPILQTLAILRKSAILANALRLTARELNYFSAHPADFGGFDLNALPLAVDSAPHDPPTRGQHVFAQIERLGAFVALRDSLPVCATDLIDLFALASRPSAPTMDTVRQQLSAASGWRLADLQTLTTAFGIVDARSFRNEIWPAAFSACITLQQQIGAPMRQIVDWAQEGFDSDRAGEVVSAARAKHTAEEWSAIARPLRDTLRERQRDALVTALTHARADNPTVPAFKDSNALFDYFLIDTGMGACQLTSRIKQAVGSVQLFIQRCFMNRERVTLPAQDQQLWNWMKSYRMWEANRKVFLWPENWIDPSLRDNKTPLFRDLEHRIGQKEVTHDNLEDVYRLYLDDLQKLARLDIVGEYYEEDSSDKTLHVIGRTPGATPHVYYYRKRVRRLWTSWERIDLDIEGEHILPVVFEGRLLLFWALFSEVTEQPKITPIPQQDQTPTPEEPAKHYEIRLAWSEYKRTKWQPKKVSTTCLITVPLSLECYQYSQEGWDDGSESSKYACHERDAIQSLEEFSFSSPTPPFGGPQRIDCFARVRHILFDELRHSWPSGAKETHRLPTGTRIDDEINPQLIGSFVFGRNGEVGVEPPREGGPQPLERPQGMHFEYEMFASDARAAAPTPRPLRLDGWPLVDSVTILNDTPTDFRLLYPHQTGSFSLERPFFFQDKERTFVVEFFLRGRLLTVRFEGFSHPRVYQFVEQMNRSGIQRMLDRGFQNGDPIPDGVSTFNGVYQPTALVEHPYPGEHVDFGPIGGTSSEGSYSLYNWELFFHAPFLVADRLRQNQQFEDAQRWFHFIFNPTARSSEPSPQRYWNFWWFFHWATGAGIEAWIRILAGSDTPARRVLELLVNEWRLHPFNPHLIARFRTDAYQKAVVMKYMDNLIEWADGLFRRETIEAINEATLLYVMAAEILGPRPAIVPSRAKIAVKTFHELAPRFEDLSNRLVDIEGVLQPTLPTVPLPPIWTNGLTTMFVSVPKDDDGALYFCVPRNDKLLRYWDKVADRLFKIRHCMDIEGRVRQLPLFEPPLDVDRLVRAAAAGIDIGSVLSDVYAGRPHYRFPVMLQKAIEFCGEVRALGSSLLSALEKRDAEDLALLRSSHELRLLQAARDVRSKQVDESRQVLEAAMRSRELADLRQTYYASLSFMNAAERAHLHLMTVSTHLQTAAQLQHVAAAGAASAPTFTSGSAGWGGTPLFTVASSGADIANALGKSGDALTLLASYTNLMAQMSQTLGSYQHRWDDWKLQEALAKKEGQQLDKQILAGQIRVEIAEIERRNHDVQLQHAQEVDEYMRQKFTNLELYEWMVSEVSAVHFRSYQLAYDLAKGVEKAFQFERVTSESFIAFGYWDKLKQGLLAGEMLEADLRRMEAAHLDQNRREYEITKHVSLAILDPVALLMLKETGQCWIELKEGLFDLDHPGHYMRRIKSVGISIPCVTGPYTSVNCRLTLQGSQVRIKAPTASAAMNYPRKVDGQNHPTADDRFVDDLQAVDAIVTSGGQNDSGLFDVNLHDERYLPFEGRGAIARWQIDLPKNTNRFDFSTISDVVLHVRYTARDGGDGAREGALRAAVKGGVRAVSVRHEFPGEWHRFIQPSGDGSRTLEIDLANRFPFQPQGAPVISGPQVVLLKGWSGSSSEVSMAPLGGDATLVSDSPPSWWPSIAGAFPQDDAVRYFGPPTPSRAPGKWVFRVTGPIPKKLDDIWLFFEYSMAAVGPLA